MTLLDVDFRITLNSMIFSLFLFLFLRRPWSIDSTRLNDKVRP